jgi:hypothetical protein
MKWENIIQTAIDEANKSAVVHRIGAVLIFRSKIVSRGYNHVSTKYHKVDKSCVLHT